jgi:hypothetical protein
MRLGATFFALCSASLGLFVAAPAVPAPVSPVQLVEARSSQCPPTSGCYRDTYLRGTVEVQNLAYAKSVGVAYKATYSGAWATAQASYLAPSNGGKELWAFDVPVAATQFAVFYTVNGQTSWDNNGGADYHVAPYAFDALLTYPAITEAQGMRSSDGATLTGTVLVKNLSYEKTIQVVYTDDDWVTVKQAPAAFYYTFPSGAEWWSYSLPVSASASESKIHMAFRYAHAGGEDWDNNYGHNYHVRSGLIAR